jgi:hypothetical protein
MNVAADPAELDGTPDWLELTCLHGVSSSAPCAQCEQEIESA